MGVIGGKERNGPGERLRDLGFFVKKQSESERGSGKRNGGTFGRKAVAEERE